MGAEGLKPNKVLGLILAGGASRRFGSDKSVAELGNHSLIAHVIARATPQVDRLVLNAASDPWDTNLTLVPDRTPGEGPLGGLLAGLYWAREHGFEYVAIFPCDTPFFPDDIVEQLLRAVSGGTHCSMVRCRGQIHCTFALVRVTCLERIEEAFGAGMRSLKALGSILRCSFADFSHCQEGPNCDAFFNINHRSDLDIAECWLQESSRK